MLADKLESAEVVHQATADETTSYLSQVYSVMADTTSMNAGKKSEISKRVADHFISVIGHDIDTLECMFHVNETYFTHIKSAIKRKTRRPWAKLGGVLLRVIMPWSNSKT